MSGLRGAALRCLCGVAPVTNRSGKSAFVERRRAAHGRLREAVFHWARGRLGTTRSAGGSTTRYAPAVTVTRGRLRWVADRLLNVACAMLRDGACFEPQRVGSRPPDAGSCRWSGAESFQKGRMRPERPGPAGVTKEHLLGPQTVRFAGDSPPFVKVRRQALRSLASLGTIVHVAHGRPRPSTAAPSSAPLRPFQGDCRDRPCGKSLAGQPEGWPSLHAERARSASRSAVAAHLRRLPTEHTLVPRPTDAPNHRRAGGDRDPEIDTENQPPGSGSSTGDGEHDRANRVDTGVASSGSGGAATPAWL